MKNLNKEKLSDMLMQVDENILDKAFYTDDPDKLNEFVSKENIRKSKGFSFGRIAAVAACLALVATATFALPALFNDNGTTNPIDESTSGNKQDDNTYVPPIEMVDSLEIKSIDMINYYSAMRLLSEKSSPELYGKEIVNKPVFYVKNESLVSQKGNISKLSYSALSNEDKENVYFYEFSPDEVFTISKAIYFQISLTEENGFLASKIGTGTVDTVITESSLETIITFKNGDRYYSCLMNGASTDEIEFSTHKYIDGFCIVKNLEQENYSFTVKFAYDKKSHQVKYDEVLSVESRCIQAVSPVIEFMPDKISVINQTGAVSYEGGSFTIGELERFFSTESHSSDSIIDSLPFEHNTDISYHSDIDNSDKIYLFYHKKSLKLRSV